MGGFIHFESKEQQGLHAHIVIPQGVTDNQPCITLNNAGQVCVACYFRPERYSCDEVRGYYDSLIFSASPTRTAGTFGSMSKTISSRFRLLCRAVMVITSFSTEGGLLDQAARRPAEVVRPRIRRAGDGGKAEFRLLCRAVMVITSFSTEVII